tara:strand:+ start:25822 stop:26109 length:288 start_codon:yes stop_codon:yes gene_type:complete
MVATLVKIEIEKFNKLSQSQKIELINQNEDLEIEFNLEKLDTEDLVTEIQGHRFHLTRSEKIGLLRAILLPYESDYNLTFDESQRLENVLNLFGV